VSSACLGTLPCDFHGFQAGFERIDDEDVLQVVAEPTSEDVDLLIEDG
jgi:hypothetical protein